MNINSFASFGKSSEYIPSI